MQKSRQRKKKAKKVEVKKGERKENKKNSADRKKERKVIGKIAKEKKKDKGKQKSKGEIIKIEREYEHSISEEFPTILPTHKVEVPEGEFRYSVYVKLTNKDILKEINIPQFLASIISLGKIPIGKILFRSEKLGGKEAEEKLGVELDFIPSFVIQMVSRHEKLSYKSEVLYDEKKGYICTFSEYTEVKKDGRRYGKKQNFTPAKGVKDPVSALLDFLGSKVAQEVLNPESSSIPIPLEVKKEKNTIQIFLKDVRDDEKLFRKAEVELDDKKKGTFLPQKAVLHGFLSLIDIVIEKE